MPHIDDITDPVLAGIAREYTAWKEGFAAARHQAANLMGHFIVDEMNIADDADRVVDLAEKCADKIMAMQDNGTRPE